MGAAPPDVDDAGQLKRMLETLHALCAEGLVGGWHDRSDGGLLVALLEMAFATRCGLDISLHTDDVLAELFAEEVGVVLGLCDGDALGVRTRLQEAGLTCVPAARRRDDERICIHNGEELAFASTRAELERRWASVSHRMQRIRDDATCADEELAAIDSDVRRPRVSGRLRSGAGYCGTLRRKRRSPPGADPARAGGERPESRWRRRSTAPVSRRWTCT